MNPEQTVTSVSTARTSKPGPHLQPVAIRTGTPGPTEGDHNAWLLFCVRTIQAARCPHQVVFRLRERLDHGPPSRNAMSKQIQ